MRRVFSTVVIAAIVAALLSAVPASSSGGGDDDDRGRCDSRRSGRSADLQMLGLTADQRLIRFCEDDPDEARTIRKVSGLSGDVRLVGIDYRPANNALYGVGNAGGVYTINTSNAAATNAGQLSVALNGTNFGVDVNPVPDALRIISDTGQNLRFSFATGTTTADTSLAYPPTPPATTPTPGSGLAAAAYTNNDADPNTATTLYDIDGTMDQVVIQAPANSGLLSPTGKLTVDTTTQVSFDIYTTVRNGSSVDVEGFAVLTVGGRSGLYEVTLFNGHAEFEGRFSSSNQLVGFAIPLNQR